MIIHALRVSIVFVFLLIKLVLNSVQIFVSYSISLVLLALGHTYIILFLGFVEVFVLKEVTY